MYHARYLDFAEHARTEFVREVASLHNKETPLLQANEVGFVVKSIHVEYHSPSFLDDFLTVKSSVTQLKRFSITLRQSIFRDEIEVATLIVRAAAVSLKTYKVIPLESWFSESLGEYMTPKEQ
ncbi:MAG: YbgC/FadM family acyl-CoA thioesterase [Spirochaetia bacterium]|nr:YbgC/FadM family acyl-CoA thioesterase [Spirochaetia bacterium]